MTELRCENCRFWFPQQRDDEGEPFGPWCRRYPRVLGVEADWWCGEHEPREVEPEQPKEREPGGIIFRDEHFSAIGDRLPDPPE